MKELNEIELREIDGGMIVSTGWYRLNDMMGSSMLGFVCGFYSGMYKSVDALFN